jgi:hypothetical protein
MPPASGTGQAAHFGGVSICDDAFVPPDMRLSIHEPLVPPSKIYLIHTQSFPDVDLFITIITII